MKREETERDVEMSDSEDDGDTEPEMVGDEETGTTTSRVYLPDQENLKNQELECDESAYVCYHSLKTTSPCLSFDILPCDEDPDAFPLSMTLVGGTESKKPTGNNLLVMKLSNMRQNKQRDEEDSDSESSDSEDEENSDPTLECVSVRHPGGVNRVKVTTLNGIPYAASWSELGKVLIWDLSSPVAEVNNPSTVCQAEDIRPLHTFAGHLKEGFALAWSPLVPGMLVSGDCNKNMHLWKPLEAGGWHVDQHPLTGHTSSVEDIQWSPNEKNVLASCGGDASIRIWDTRAKPSSACMLTRDFAHDADVNVINWNVNDTHFLLSGGDDAKIKVWDLRQFPSGDSICTFAFHTGPVTSVEWHPSDRSVFAASSEDDVLSQWDIALERDSHIEEEDEKIKALPPQLLFLHQGQQELKELHWYRKVPGVLVSTAITGINVFKTVSV